MGADWYMEDTTSIQYHNQFRLDKDVLVWDVQMMPESWTGSTILEICSVPHQLIKRDNYATLEQVGKWMRCTVAISTEWDGEALQQEYERILAWIDTPDHAKHVPHHAKQSNHAKHVPHHVQQSDHVKHVMQSKQTRHAMYNPIPVFSPTHYPYSSPMMKKVEYDFHETKKRL